MFENFRGPVILRPLGPVVDSGIHPVSVTKKVLSVRSQLLRTQSLQLFHYSLGQAGWQALTIPDLLMLIQSDWVAGSYDSSTLNAY